MPSQSLNMCHSLSGRHFLLILLVLATAFSLVASQDEEQEIGEVEAEVEADLPEESNTEETTEAGASLGSDGEFTPAFCDNPDQSVKTKCCKLLLDLDDAFIKCFMLHQKKMPKNAEENPIALIKFFSCLIECVYKAKKYMTKDDKINMKMVKADAKKLYKDKPKQHDFLIEQYEYCENKAHSEWDKMKKNPAARVLFAGACKPYYMFVMLCIMDYGKIHCPHHQWSNSKEFKEECKQMKEKCSALVD